MALFDIIIALLMTLIGVCIGVAVTGLANIFGIAGWIVGLVVALLVLAFIYLDDKLMGFQMKHSLRLFGRLWKVETDGVAENYTKRYEYYAFLLGAVIGIAASLIWSPSFVVGLLRYLRF